MVQVVEEVRRAANPRAAPDANRTIVRLSPVSFFTLRGKLTSIGGTVKILPSLAVYIACLATFGCSTRSGDRYFPMGDKATWEYSLEMLTPQGSIVKGEMVLRVDGKESISGKDYYKTVSVASGIPGAETQYGFVRADVVGIYAIDKDKKDFGEYLVAPLPLKVGAGWDIASPSGKAKCQVENFGPAELMDRKIEDCARISCAGVMSIKGQDLKFESTTYRCPDIGVVKETEVLGGLDRFVLSQTLKNSKL